MTFGQHFERYAVLRRAANIAYNTINNEHKAHKILWNFLGDELDELQVRKQHILDYAVYVNKSDWSLNTKNARLKALRPFYKTAVIQDWMLTDPTAGLRLPKREQIVPKVLTVRQMKDLLNMPDLTTAKGIMYRTIMELLYSCGLRQDELLNLKLENFSDDYRTLQLVGKGGKEAVLPVTRMAAYFLSFYVQHVRPKTKYQELFILFGNKKPLSRVVLGMELRRFAPVTCHTFRYSIATHLADEGVDIRVLQEFLRHESINTTSHYIAQDIQKLQEIHRKTHPHA